jgi:TonB family protein
VQGSTHGAPGTGVHGVAAGDDHRKTAAAAFARPDVTQGPVSIPATDRARPKDDMDSSQAVAKTLRSIVHGSYAGGAAGDGNGGSGGGGAPGAGGQSGEGSHPPPLGLGEGDLYDLETSDPRLLPYFRKLHAKIEPLWQNAFPRSAMLDLKQGTVILEFDIAEDGTATVKWPPLRPSGIDEFDRNCADAIRRAAPFDPIPAVLGVKHLRVRAPFVASNPIVK